MKSSRIKQLLGLSVISSLFMTSILQAHSGRHPMMSVSSSEAGSAQINRVGVNIGPLARIPVVAESASSTLNQVTQAAGESLTFSTLTDPSSVLFADDFDSENGGNGELNYFGFANWNVMAGSVDLIGNGFADFLPGHGLYLDLDGTTFAAGTLETKTTFTLVPATYRLQFSLAGSQLGQANRVDVTLGHVYSESFTLESDVPFTTITRDIVVSTETSGKLVFQAFGNDNIGLLLDNVRLLTDITEPVLFNLSPDHGGNTGNVTVNLSGINFPAGTVTAKLSAQGQPDIVAISAVVISATQIIATFDLTGAGLGLRDAVVTFPDGPSLTRQNAFTIEPGIAPQLWVDIIGRDTIRLGVPQTYNLIYGNRGNIDAVGVPLWIGGIPNDASVQLGFNLLTPALLPGQGPVSWNEIPTLVKDNNEKYLPLFVPLVPAGSTKTLQIKLAVPMQEQFQLRSWLNSPYFQSPLKTDVGVCMGQFVDAVAKIPPVFDCLYTGASFLYDQYILNGMGDGVASQTWTYFQVVFNCSGELIPELQIVELAVDLVNLQNAATSEECQRVFGKTVEAITPLIRTVNSRDPNDKVGALGVGSSRFLSGREPLRYAIYFENVETATAPAQEVVITDQLDTAKLDLNTFSFGPIAFGNKLVTPPPGVSEFNQDVDLRPANDLIVRINAGLDKNTGLLTWRFASIDPATGFPTEDPLAGFLPPNVNAPEGDGSVLFTVMTKQDLVTGTEIRNQAQIIFDVNAPIDTPPWFNTLDNSAPASSVQALTVIPCSANTSAQWSGTDTGSGIRDYTVYVSDNGGPFTIWQSNTTATSGSYSGQFGHTYAFYSVAQDKAGNVEKPPVSPDATVTLTASTRPPTIILTGQVITLWPVNHQYKTVSLAQLVASASNNCGGDLTGNVVILQVSSDEPEDSPGGGDGNTLNDIVISPNCKSVQLRAERQGSGNGRVYTITFRVSDAAGDTATATSRVRVPKSQNGNPTVDDGPSYTVTGVCP